MTGRRIAVIGGGISGLTAGYVLSRTDHVTLFEAGRRLGGHADTRLVGPVPVDTGFIVYNERTYPLLTRLLAELGATTRPAQMSLSVRCAGCGLRYAGKRGPGGLAAGLRSGGGRLVRLLADVPRFHGAARRLLAGELPRSAGTAGSDTPGSRPGGLTFGEFLNDGGYSGYFQAHFTLPLVAAVWSCPGGAALRYPARYLFAFLANHGMLSVPGSPPWRTVTGGSRCYVERAPQRLACVRLGTPVRAVRRYPDGAEVRDASGRAHRFDAVVIATHPDQALAVLSPATRAEREVLGAFRYTPNPALLHTDASLLPGHPRGPGVLELPARPLPGRPHRPRDGGADQLPHDRLQRLPAGQDYIVTLNGQAAVDRGRPRELFRRLGDSGLIGHVVGLFGISLGSWAGLATVFAPLMMTYILTRGTGQRLADRRMAATRPQYAEYAARTSGFIRFPRAAWPTRTAGRRECDIPAAWAAAVVGRDASRRDNRWTPPS